MTPEQFNKLPKEQREKTLMLCHSIARIFSGSDGQEVLSYWLQQFVLTDVASPNKTEQQRLHDGGKAAFVLGIQQAIDIAHKN